MKTAILSEENQVKTYQTESGQLASKIKNDNVWCFSPSGKNGRKNIIPAFRTRNDVESNAYAVPV